jgi:hypothetical protein
MLATTPHPFEITPTPKKTLILKISRRSRRVELTLSMSLLWIDKDGKINVSLVVSGSELELELWGVIGIHTRFRWEDR